MARRTALQVLQRVHKDDAYSHIALSEALDAASLSPEDRGLATELVYGTLTWQRAIDRILDDALHRGLKSVRGPLLDVLRLAVYQLVFLDRIPDHAAIDESVKLCREVAGEGASGLVNAVLRTIARADEHQWWNETDRERKPARWLGERWSLPNWLSGRMIQQFGLDRAASLAEAFNQRPPLWLRRTGQPLAEAAWRTDGMTDEVRQALAAHEAVVQDLGSQLVARYCGTQAGEHVLDACAGVGGKSLALLEEGARVTALDPQASKLQMLEKTADELGVADRVTAVDTELQNIDFEGPFDGVLVDAPCTGLGTLRRHPEARWRRRQADITTLSRVQENLLDEAAMAVRPGGWLTYSVCTFTREETTKQIELFLERHPEFERAGSLQHEAIDELGELHTFPDLHDADAFYAARLERRRGD
jgi:16S rRNA (cytosine967-C5)-methyltransferase